MKAYVKGTLPATHKGFTGQGALLWAVLTDVPQTTPVLAGLIKERLITRQDPERVVVFYVSTWKKKGFVKEVTAEGTVVEQPVSDEPSPAEVEAVTKVAEPRTGPQGVPAQGSTLPNLQGKKLSEAVLAVLEFKAKALDVPEIVEVLNKNGHPFTSSQVTSAVQNLLRKESVVKVGDTNKIALAA